MQDLGTHQIDSPHPPAIIAPTEISVSDIIVVRKIRKLISLFYYPSKW